MLYVDTQGCNVSTWGCGPLLTPTCVKFNTPVFAVYMLYVRTVSLQVLWITWSVARESIKSNNFTTSPPPPHLSPRCLRAWRSEPRTLQAAGWGRGGGLPRRTHRTDMVRRRIRARIWTPRRFPHKGNIESSTISQVNKRALRGPSLYMPYSDKK